MQCARLYLSVPDCPVIAPLSLSLSFSWLVIRWPHQPSKGHSLLEQPSTCNRQWLPRRGESLGCPPAWCNAEAPGLCSVHSWLWLQWPHRRWMAAFHGTPLYPTVLTVFPPASLRSQRLGETETMEMSHLGLSAQPSRALSTATRAVFHG